MILNRKKELRDVFKVIFFSHTIRLLTLCIFNSEIKALNLVCFIGSEGISQFFPTTMKSFRLNLLRKRFDDLKRFRESLIIC